MLPNSRSAYAHYIWALKMRWGLCMRSRACSFFFSVTCHPLAPCQKNPGLELAMHFRRIRKILTQSLLLLCWISRAWAVSQAFGYFITLVLLAMGSTWSAKRFLLNVLNLSRVKSEKPGEPRSEWIEFAVLTGKAGCSWFRIVLSTVLNSETTSVCSVVYYHIKLSGCLVVPVWSLGAFRLTDCGRCWLTRIASACRRFLSTARRYCTVPARDNRWYDLSEYLVQVWKNDVLTIIGDGLSQRWLALRSISR